MRISEFEAICMVNLYGSFMEASKHSGIPVSTLSRRVSSIENELGIQVLDRKAANGAITLSPEGEQILPLIQSLLKTNAYISTCIKDALNEDSGTLRVGETCMACNTGCGRILAEYMGERPDINIIYVLRSQFETVRLLKEGQIECGFVCNSSHNARYIENETFSESQFIVTPIKESDEMYIAVSEDCALAQQKSINIEDLKPYTLIFNKWVKDAQVAERFLRTYEVNVDEYKYIYEDFSNKAYWVQLVRTGQCAVFSAFPEEPELPGIKFIKLEDWKTTHSIVLISSRYGSEELMRFNRWIAHMKEENRL